MMIKTFISLTFVLIVFNVSALAQNVPTDSGPKLVSGADFQISADDEAAGIDGTIKLAVDIDSSGNVARAETYVAPSWPCTTGLEKRVVAVMREAEKAVTKFRFAPAMKNGKAISARVAIKMTIGREARKPIEPRADSPDLLRRPQTAGFIAAGVVNGRATSLPKPEYPTDAKSAGQTGEVVVQVLLGEDGKVISAQAIEGPPLLQFAARTAACGAKFTPTLLQGKPVKVSGTIHYNFVP